MSEQPEYTSRNPIPEPPPLFPKPIQNFLAKNKKVMGAVSILTSVAVAGVRMPEIQNKWERVVPSIAVGIGGAGTGFVGGALVGAGVAVGIAATKGIAMKGSNNNASLTRGDRIEAGLAYLWLGSVLSGTVAGHELSRQYMVDYWLGENKQTQQLSPEEVQKLTGPQIPKAVKIDYEM